VLSSDVYGLWNIDDEAFLLLKLVYGSDGRMESLVCKAVEVSIFKKRESGDEKIGRGQSNQYGSELHGERVWCSIRIRIVA
jgi:hypothetical protein